MVISSSWWLNQPNWKICSPNWILFPKETTTYSYSAYKSKGQWGLPQYESTNQVIWHADFCQKNGRVCSDPYDINWTLKHLQSSYSKRVSISTKNLLVTVLWNLTVPVYMGAYIYIWYIVQLYFIHPSINLWHNGPNPRKNWDSTNNFTPWSLSRHLMILLEIEHPLEWADLNHHSGPSFFGRKKPSLPKGPKGPVVQSWIKLSWKGGLSYLCPTSTGK